MTNNEKILWGIHAGRTGDADTLFLKNSVIALGWHQMGDLTPLQPNRETFRAKLITAYPDTKPGAVPVEAGQLFRFVHEMRVGDYVAYPSKHERQIHIGQVTGEYQYNLRPEPGYPHQRSVKWLRSFPRTRFTQGALYEIGSAMSLFQIRNYIEEYLSALEDMKETPGIPPEEDKTVSVVAEEIEEITQDFILKQLSQELKGHPLSHFVAHLLETMGYRTRISPEGPDGGIDIIAHKDELGFEPPLIKVQVKSSDGSIGAPAVQALYGNIDSSNKEYGLFVALGSFTLQARNFARSRSNLRLIDGEELVKLVLEHYEQFDSSYKGRIPLKKMYIPQSLKDEE
jgi:restriction system protein